MFEELILKKTVITKNCICKDIYKDASEISLLFDFYLFYIII